MAKNPKFDYKIKYTPMTERLNEFETNKEGFEGVSVNEVISDLFRVTLNLKHKLNKFTAQAQL